MKHLPMFERMGKYRTHLLTGMLLAVAVLFAGIGMQSRAAFTSPEVKFTDASHSGLAIVPASCPSRPNDADAPYGCSGSTPLCPNGSAAPGGVVGQCTCAQGNTAVCARCPDGSLAPNNNASQCTCQQGNTAACVTAKCPDGSAAPNGNVSQCTCAQGNAAACNNGSCQTGYSMNNAGTCVFSGCPAGYTLAGSSCILSCAAGQHAVGSVCVCDSTNLPADANGQCTAQACPSGYQYDPGSGQCILINQCTKPPICSDAKHVLNQCTGAVTNCAVNGPGWICQNGGCVQSPPPIASISASPSLLSPGYTTTVSWTSQNTTSCKVTGNNGDGVWTGTAGTHTSSAIQSQTIFTLVCDGYDGSVVKQTAVANLVPTFIEN